MRLAWLTGPDTQPVARAEALAGLGLLDHDVTLLRRAEAISRGVGARLELGSLLARIACIDSEESRAALVEAASIAEELGCGPDSPLGRQLAKARATL